MQHVYAAEVSSLLIAACYSYCAVLVVFISNINGYQSNTPVH